eukprot:evm.model.scf_2302.3 EVM.evm.TU.scf_2302.3   scf_2302:23327-24696(+)
MLAYEKALKLICLLEHPRADGLGEETYEEMIEELVAAKFRCVVAAQSYGRNRKSSVLKQRWDARSVELLCCRLGYIDASRLSRNKTLRVSYIDTDRHMNGYTQYAVLIRGAAIEYADRPDRPNPSEDKYRVEEVYRVRFPQNVFTGRGIIIGEGKPENQNHAIIFAFGECLQTIDMNQDNFLLEALKMRNLLRELTLTEPRPRKDPKTCREYQVFLRKRLERKL